jgi:VanZ family protein
MLEFASLAARSPAGVAPLRQVHLRRGVCVSRGTLNRIASVLFWLAMAITLVLATLPEPPQVPLPGGDKVLHMTAFAALSLLAWLAFPRRRVVQLFIAMAALGALIEALQSIPALHREADVSDWLADCGASLAVLVSCQCVRWMMVRCCRQLEDG